MKLSCRLLGGTVILVPQVIRQMIEVSSQCSMATEERKLLLFMDNRSRPKELGWLPALSEQDDFSQGCPIYTPTLEGNLLSVQKLQSKAMS